MRSAPLLPLRSCRAPRCPTHSSAILLGPDPYERLDRAPFVHRLVGLRDMVEVGLEIKDAPRIDAAIEDLVKQLRDVGARRRYPAAQPDVAKDHGLHRVLDVVGDPDNANDRPGSGDAPRRRHRLAGAAAFERGVDANPIGQREDRLDRGAPATGTRTASPWPPSISPFPNAPPATHCDVTPARQCGHVPSQYLNGAITRSPTAMPDTSAPMPSITPMNS